MKKTIALLGLAAVSAFAADAKKGAEVFDANCAVCHNSDSTDTKIGPGLKGLFKRETLVNKKKVSEANVIGLVSEGGNGMPGFGDALTKAEKDDLIAFLKGL